MKNRLLFLSLSFLIVSGEGLLADGPQEKERIQLNKMNIEGDLQEAEVPVEVTETEEDQELVQLDKLLKENKKTLHGYEKKGRKYGQLTTVVEKMQEKHREYLDNKLNYEEVVARMNGQLESQNGGAREQQSGQDAYAEEVFRLFKTQEKNFQICYQNHLEQTASTKNRDQVMIDFEVNAQGQVSRSQILQEEVFASKVMITCFQNVLRGMQFPRPLTASGLLRIRQPIILNALDAKKGA